MQRAFEQLDTRQAGRVAVAEFGRTLKALGVQVSRTWRLVFF
jgi:Ca2+-binding EF-hand superfamily protein